MKRIHIIATIGLALCALLSIAGFILGKGDFVKSVNAAEILFVGPLFLFIATLLLLALKSFTTKLKIAYVLMCVGMVFLAYGFLQYILIGKVNPLDSQLSLTIMVRVPTTIFVLFMLTGTTLFARLLGTPHAVAFGWAAFATALSAAIASIFIPLPPSQLPWDHLHTAFAFATFNIIMSTSIAVVIFRARAKAGPLYVPSLAWMFVAAAVFAAGIISYTPAQLFLPVDNVFVTYGLSAAIVAVAGVFYVKSALEFNKIAYTTNLPPAGTHLSFFGKAVSDAQEGPGSAIDVVIYVASFASNPNKLDPIMDPFRNLTARVDAQDLKLSPEQQTQLADIYNRVVDFLVHSEEVRKYSRDELRTLVVSRFADGVVDGVFWETVRKA